MRSAGKVTATNEAQRIYRAISENREISEPTRGQGSSGNVQNVASTGYERDRMQAYRAIAGNAQRLNASRFGATAPKAAGEELGVTSRILHMADFLSNARADLKLAGEVLAYVIKNRMES